MKFSPVLPFASVVLSLVPACPAVAQLTPDNTLGAENSVVTPVDPTRDRIDGGAVRGSNLFHSFQEFNVDAGRSVYFANPTGIENILTRVTGSNPSNIFGTLGVLGGANVSVNLFLVNPNGIIFGPNASLDISGSFFATTSEEIKLGPDGIFSATNPEGSQLLNIQPEAIFTNALANHMAQINNQAGLAVGVGSTLALQGGEVTVTGSLAAPGGTVMVLGERVGLLDNASIDVSGQGGNGRVLIGGGLTVRDDTPTAVRTYIGPDVTIAADALETGDGGTVIARAEEVTGFYGEISTRGGSSSGNGGTVEVSGNSHLIFRGQVDASAVNGNPGTLQLETTDIIVGNGTGIVDDVPIADDILKAPLSEISSAASITIYESELEGLSGNTQVMATNDILVADLQDDLLELAAGTGEIAFTADGDNDGVGDFVMLGLGDSISTQGRNISISGANVTFGISFMGEAGQLITDAMVVSTSPGESLENISGELSNRTDVDLYQVYLTGEGTFSATTVDGTSVPTQLFLFNINGMGVYGNDNAPDCDCNQSTLVAENALTPTAPGIYYLGITGRFVNPISIQGEIFSLDGNEVSGPTGQGGGSPLSGWDGNGGLANLGKYSIALTGVAGENNIFTEPIRGEVITSGGAINIETNNGSIAVGDLDTSSVIGAGGEMKITAESDITTGNINTNSLLGKNGVDIAIKAGGNITTENINSSSSQFGEGDGGSGGNISLTAGGDIATELIDSSSTAFTGNAGDGGAMAITAGGNIINGLVNSQSISVSLGNGGSGGKIAMNAGGNITTESIFSSSTANLGNTENGGAIVLEAGGNIVAEDLLSRSDSIQGKEGDGGEISLTSSNGSITTGQFSSSGGTGRGNITLTAKNDITLIPPDSQIRDLNASGDGPGGNISFTSQTGRISIENFLITSNADSSGTVQSGNGGSLFLAANAVTLKNVDVSTTVLGQGNSGAIAISSSGEVMLDRTRLFTGLEPDSIGDGGNIEITAGSVSLSNSSFIDTATSGRGDAGNVTIRAESLDLNSSSIFSITSGEGKAGNVTVVSDAISLSDVSNISTAVDPRGIGDGGEINLFGRSLSLTGGSQLQALTRGVGDSGTIQINVTDEITVSGIGKDGFVSGMFTSTEGDNSGRGNSIEIGTGRLLVNDGAVVSAETNSPSPGGNIAIDANTLELRNGGQLLTNAFSSGEAGNITVNVREGVIVSGVDPNFADRIPPPRPREPQVTDPTTLTKTEPNDSIEEAQEIDEFFSLDSEDNFNSDVEFATRIPYVSIAATGSDPATVDYYSISVEVPGTRGTFDIDDGFPANVDDRLSGLGVNTLVSLFDSEGNLLASNDNASPAFGAGGSSDGLDSYLKYGFSTPGTYFIKVEARDGGLIPAPATYDLQVSLDTPNVTGTVVNAEAASGMFARTSGPGAAGNITINSPQLTVSDGAEISATATATATARGGNITANADRINLTGASELAAETQGIAPAGTITLQPVNNQPNLIVTMAEGSQISVSTQGAGAGGNLTLKAPSAITLTGPGQLSVETNGSGPGGNAEIETGRLRVLSGARVSAATRGDGDGGNLIVSATERVTLTSGSSFSSETTGNGDAGSLEISTDRFTVSEGGEATVSSTGTGSAGELRVAAGSAIELDNGTLSAASLDVGDLGDINLTAPRIRLDNNSLITTNAANIATGGNITINSDFLIARDNSDISANGVSGFGDVNIVAEGIFLDNDSEITATGEVRINGVINPASGLVEFQESPIDPEKIIAQNFCVLAKESSFIITGRGGIAINPGDYLTGEGTRVGLVDPVTGENASTSSRSRGGQETENSDVADDEIRQAQGWVQLADGTVILTSYPVISTPHGPLLQHPDCNHP
ncbi:MAG: filamentous hemagglutinin N-terminal domain-containing protein [Hormoscilla sp.]